MGTDPRLACVDMAGMRGLAFHTSTQIGGVAREILLHEGAISYVFMVVRKGA